MGWEEWHMLLCDECDDFFQGGPSLESSKVDAKSEGWHEVRGRKINGPARIWLCPDCYQESEETT